MDRHTQPIKTISTPPINVLLVDDEQQILRALTRLIRPLEFQVFTASCVSSARKILHHEPIDIVITDLKMPFETGDILLAEIVTQRPCPVRILLTGFADLVFVKSLLNRGEIDFYLEKPWDKNELVALLKKAKDKVITRHAKHNKIHKINYLTHKLRVKNASFVAALTASIKQQKEAACEKKVAVDDAIASLLNIVEVSPQIDECFAHDVSLLAVQLAKMLGFTSKQTINLMLAAKLCEIGLLGASIDVATQPIQYLHADQRAEYLNQVNYAQRVLKPIPALHCVSDIIVQQFLQPLDAIHAGIDILEEALVLSVCRDICLLKYGRLTGEEENESTIRRYINKHASDKYSADIARAASDLVNQYDTFLYLGKKPVRSLRAGMVVKSDLRLKKGQLLFPKGHKLTQRNIQRLLVVEQNIDYPLLVPVTTSLDLQETQPA
ncbi:response regulator [Alteromonas sediminis]|uniref:response regulator n=1 Tax=Alteromonas sediminis TaxID=2259342 RepID=UPI00140534EF|nr:response regulator [Alteromonas sediminis]